ncbi:hypothetical protein BKA66DRAFT_310497 [Pyrenochaeta sp. MPI-SDFR-AT-0127]|nr:hypothetical protein BKA66DRAFT_310497 [Pyrenochaeta sp. MPI-SDFR-AT-0127]
MDNGMEVVAKLPNPNAGPARYTTASEVATRTMLRDIFSVPVPRVLSWSSDAANSPVQAEYILEEKAQGVRLGALWLNLPWRTKLSIVEQVVDIDSSLTALQFESHGSIYFKEDLQRLSGNAETVKFTTDQPGLNLDPYAMGPLTKAELWVSGREQMNLDRGPWKDTKAYVQDLGANETAWIQRYAKPRMNYFSSLENPEQPSHALDLLAKYQRLAPFLTRPANISATANVLWHPDLHLDNVFVDPITHKITSIIDWQSAMSAPLFLQSGVHRAFRHYKSVREGWVMPEKPADFDTLPPDEQVRIDQDIESETIHKYYELQTMKRAPHHWDYLQRPKVAMLRKPVWLVTGAWENRDLFFLRDSIISLFSRWNELFGEDVQCPITFSAEELDQHAREEENVDGLGKMLSLFRDQGVLPADGMVQPEDYDIAVENCRKYKKIFLDAAQTQDERYLYSKIWPYQDVCDDI